MPEYRRFIAYFNLYIDGKKQKNAGFTKVELRNGMWRILFRINDVRQPEPPVQVYGFVRTGGYLLGLPMGSLRPGNPMMEEWAYRAEVPIWENKYHLADLNGIWIQSGDGRCYISTWDDEPVLFERFVTRLELEPVEESQQLETADQLEPAEESPQPETADQPESVEESPQPEAEEQSESVPGSFNTISGSARTEAAEFRKEDPISELFERRKHIHPFEDEEFRDCVQIMPCDLMRMQQSGLQIGRSSFLIHGFYQYHHLLLGQLCDGDYVIGVPGMYNPQEQYMAQMFGFSVFKSTREQRGRGRFGYWYRPLEMPQNKFDNQRQKMCCR